MPNIFNAGNNLLTFEDFKNENGLTYWWASDLMVMLGYSTLKSFQKVLDRTTKAFVSLNIPHYENIIAVERESGYDFKLTRFACYLAAMNADSKKQEVATAQAYFAQQTRSFELHLQGSNEVERIVTRGELAEGNTSLAATAAAAGVQDYAKFQNAGYLGMYNMPSWKLEKLRNVEKQGLFERMGRVELAANLFRVTMTEARIKNKGIEGQSNLEKTHTKVGREVRDMVIENTGIPPERLPQEKRLPEIKKELKTAQKKMAKADKK